MLAGGDEAASQEIQISNAGGGELTSLETSVSYANGQPVGWLSATLGSTTAPTTLMLQPATSGLEPGLYRGHRHARVSGCQ